MANPLKGADEGSTSSRAVGPMAIGETRTFVALGKPIHVTRTHRAYAYDLCDAYNEAMSDAARDRGLEYFIDGNGHVKLGERQSWSSKRTVHLERTSEYARKEWMRRNHEGEYSLPPQEAMGF